MTSEIAFFCNETQGRVLVFRPDLCSGCGECIEVCPQRFLRAAPSPQKAVEWKVKTFPEPETSECAECTLCLPWVRGGGQHFNESWVVCPWRACTMCDECARVCPDRAIYTLPLAAEEAPETTEGSRAPTSEPVSYEHLALEPPAVPFC